MQEKLKFLHKPEIDYEKLSNIAEYFDKLMRFNEQYGMNLEYTPKARWKPGTYDKIKKKYVEIEHPQWTRKRGANNLRKLFEHNDWNARNFRQSLHKSDEMMANYRYNGQLLVDGNTIEQGKELLDEVYESLKTNVADVDVEVTPFPYWNRAYYEDGFQDKPFVPFLAECNVLDFDNDGCIGDTTMFDMDTSHWKSTNPRHWYVNIIFRLDDVNLRVYLKGEKGEIDSNLLHTQPYGEILLGLSIPLYDYCLGRRAAYANTRLRRWSQNITFFAYQQPVIPGLRHPYIYRDDQTNYTLHHQTRQYGLGNLCLGDWHEDILKQIFYGNLGIAKALLRTWSEVYYIHSTGPLNTLHQSFAGNHKDWSELTRQSIGVSPSNCERTLRYGYDEASLLEDHCSNCTLANNTDCAIYKRMTYTPRELNGEFGEWAINQAKEYEEMDVAVGLKVLFTRLYNNTESLSPERALQNALFNDGGKSFPEARGHLTTKFMDDTYLDMIVNMKSDDFEFNKLQLDVTLKVMERIFYDYRFRQMSSYHGSADAVYNHWVGQSTPQAGLCQAESEYPIDELQATIHQIEFSAGCAELMPDGRFKKSNSNDFITYLKNIGEIDNE